MVMNDTCSYPVDRDETLIAYLYDDIDPVARATFDAHLMTCGSCRDELTTLRGVRSQLAHWAPPEANPGIATRQSPVAVSTPERRTTNSERRTANGERRMALWRELPVCGWSDPFR